MAIFDRILILIKKKGWNISEFERRLEKSTGTFNGWRNRQSIPAKMFPKIATLLGVSEAYLRGETNIPLPAHIAMKSGEILPVDPTDPQIQKILQGIKNMDNKTLNLLQIYIDALNGEKDK